MRSPTSTWQYAPGVRRLELVGLLFLSTLGVAAEKARTDPILPGIPVPPGYPDEQAVIVKSGTISFSLTVDGTVTSHPDPDKTVVHTLKVNARETISIAGVGGTRNFSYQATDTMLIIEDGKTSTVSTKTHSSGSKPLKARKGKPYVLAPMAMSVEQGAACADLMSALGGGEWEIPGITGEMTTNGVTVPTDGLCTVRIPCRGNTGGIFSMGVNAWEAAGVGESGIPMADNGYVEMPWKDGGGFGQHSAAMRAWSIGPGVCVNTAPVSRVMFAKQPGQIDFFDGVLTVSWQLGAEPQKCELVLAPCDDLDRGRAKLAAVYEKWLPEPRFARAEGQVPLTIQAEFKAKVEGEPAPRGRIDFYLTDVSRHRGECNNFPRDRGEKDDLRFGDDQAEGIKIDPADPLHAYTDEQVERAFVWIVSEDGGAHGRIRAECKERNLQGLYERLGTFCMSIPKDDDGNHVADSWEEEKGVSGKSTDADDEEVSGQSSTGDGISLYREYRGFQVLEEGGARYRRLDPKGKDFFIIDAGNRFDADLWKKASEITAYRVDDSLIQGGSDVNTSRIVDYTIGESTGQHKYALRLETCTGLVERTPYRDQKPDAPLCYGYTDNQGHSPRTTERCVIFPDRIRAMIDRVREYVREGVSDPDSESGAAIKAADIPMWLAAEALKKLDSAARDRLVQQMTTVIAIHESGHACGLSGHRVGGAESPQGDPKCPMKYTDKSENRKLLILQVLFALDNSLPLQYDHFCRGGQFDCFSDLDVKD